MLYQVKSVKNIEKKKHRIDLQVGKEKVLKYN